MAESAPVKKPRAAPTHPKTIDMVVEAIKSLKDKKGSSVQAIKAYITSHYPTVSESHLTSSLRRALKSGLESGVLVRPKGSTATGVTGRLRVGKLPEKPKKKKKPAKKTTPKKKPAKKPKDKKTKEKKVAKTKKAKSTPKKTAKKTPKKDSKPKKPAKKATKKPVKKATKKPVAKKSPKKTPKPKKPKTKAEKK